jgi:hypothetical protein
MRWGAVQRPRLWSAMIVLCALTGVLAFGAGSALADLPEEPELKVEEVFATTATFKGILSPKATEPNEGGTYQFVYRATNACKGAGEKLAPASPGISLGAPAEPVNEPVSGLTPNTEYTVCLSMTNLKSETAVSAGVSVKTTKAAPPEAPEATEVTERKPTTATLNGVINPKSAGEPGKYQFIYRQSASECTGAGEVETPKEPVPGTSPQPVSAAITGLVSGKPYTFCAKAFNALGEATLSTPKTFAAAIPPETPEKQKATEVTATTATLNGVLNPKAKGEPGAYQFLYSQSPGSCEGGSATPAAASTASSPQPVSAKVTGLLPGAPYTFCLRAENQAGEFVVGPPETFMRPPAIESASSANETPSSADLSAKINPDSAATTCAIEYGPSLSYGTTKPCEPASLGSGTAGVLVSRHLEGLENTTYHWRVVASNASGGTPSPDQTFVYPIAAHAEPCFDAQIRQERGSSSLPDCRAYEMVTPPQKNGALIGGAFIGPLAQIAREGGRVIAVSFQCFAGPESCVPVRQTQAEPFEFTRTGGGWVTHPLAPPAGFETDSFWSMNADLGTALFSIPRGPEGQDDYYAHRSDGSFVAVGPAGENPEDSVATNGLGYGTETTADLSHVVYEPLQSLWAFDHTGGKGVQTNALYEYEGTGNTTPYMVGVSGGYENHENHKLISECGTELAGLGLQKHYGSLSADGRTVYFNAVRGNGIAGCPPVDELYARVDGEMPDARSVLISGPTLAACTSEECKENTSKAKEPERARSAVFDGAATDGSRVFFTDTQQLTNGASEDSNAAANGICYEAVNNTPGTSGCNLYESECPNGNRCAQSSERRLIDVSEGPGGVSVPGGPRVQGVVAMSADGSHVYFVAKGVLTGEEENQSHEKAKDEEDNLYVYGEGHLAFIATLSASDEEEWTVGRVKSLSANVTPDGRFLVFTSHRALTADLTRPQGPAQVFEYDAQTKGLVRVSIGDGGFNDNGNEGAGDASIVPVLRAAASASAPVRSDPTMSDDGAFVFFQSPVALTPGALNDFPIGEGQFAQNVYEYHEGHVFLVSDGKDTAHESLIPISPVELLGSDASGANVFFATFDRLLPEDTDTQRDFYDAHICSTTMPCTPPKPAPPAPCEGEACHGTPPGQSTGQTPGSASFIGPGNLTPPAPPKPRTAAQIRAEKLARALKACRRKHNKHKRALCEKHARKLYAAAVKAKKSKRAGNDGRAKP